MVLRCILTLLCFWLASPAAANEQILRGPATAIDGDTLAMGDLRVRLADIDAPETAQTCNRDGEDWACGAEAGEVLAELVADRTVICRTRAIDVYGRYVAVCHAGSTNLGMTMVQAGLAIALEGSPQELADAQARLRALRYGIWASEFQVPADWRAAHPRARPQSEIANNREPRSERDTNQPTQEREYRNEFGCAIKGNRSRRGEWIYHLPGRPYYEETRPEELFCTESEAQRAGYRRSRA
ncbi:thermonuclease family protein [Alteraurantiacibacter aquimixticola]|uniref:Thermonuclease family protein n=2 Tax=Alteraurantiacibacter aquimixticola TaxID=2489173 RepID=A0A4T3F0B1_9SPHN|nr:thermonuclease family protein [Alteraurantiacibacter aquimixticola]